MAVILYNSEIHTTLLNFALKTEHTGSKHDYENFLNINLPTGPLLRLVYPAITHQNKIRNDWYKSGGIKEKWFKNHEAVEEMEIGSIIFL
ncbi:DUF2515 family protein [Virgibacillus sp. NKC19-16]|uniref:DUF2515 family protein n=1 Tax=Virgibacillus salidurans TaxID=2831673 RepID=UPI002107F4B6|nr:DUF2515 family protein [Virgibacillus sp. NKC19-16]UJL48067.1 DUF2515 family protein [Virgibacillus sp. NKC19-16]